MLLLLLYIYTIIKYLRRRNRSRVGNLYRNRNALGRNWNRIKHSGRRKLGKIWVIQSVEVDPDISRDPLNSIVGGGICIHPDGYIVTACHVATLDLDLDSSSRCLIMGRLKHEDAFYELAIVKAFPEYDLCLLKVKDPEGNKFGVQSLHRLGCVGEGSRTFGFVHQGDMPFSARYGYTCYPFTGSLEVFPFEDVRSVESDPTDYRLRVLEISPQYLTVGAVVDKPRGSKLQVPGRLSLLHPDLPLIEMQGFGMCGGQSGCPVFSCNDNEFLGIVSFVKSCFQYVVPVQFIRQLLVWYLLFRVIGVRNYLESSESESDYEEA